MGDKFAVMNDKTLATLSKIAQSVFLIGLRYLILEVRGDTGQVFLSVHVFKLLRFHFFVSRLDIGGSIFPLFIFVLIWWRQVLSLEQCLGWN